MTQATWAPLTPREAVDRAAFFGSLPVEAREALPAYLVRCELPAGAVVVREGEAGDDYYFIAAGEAEVWAAKGGRPTDPGDGDGAWTPDPRRHTLLARLGPGEGFGEMALLLGGQRRATIRAATDLVCYTLDRATFTRVVNEHRGLAVALEEEMALRAVAGFLGRASPFINLPPEGLRWLALRLQPVRFEAGQDIVRQGGAGDAFYLVRDGRVAVLDRRRDGTEQALATLGPGDAFGEQALLTDEPRSATVRALEPVEVLRLSRGDFEAVLQEHRERGSYFLQLALQRQRPRRIEHWAMERWEGRDGAVVCVLKDTDKGRYLKLSEQAAFLWELMDGEHTVRDLTLAYLARYRTFGLDAVMRTMVSLHQAGFVRIQRVDRQRLGEVAQLSFGQRLGLRLLPWVSRLFAIPNVDPVVTWLYRFLLRPLYFRPVQGLLLIAVLAGAALFTRYLVAGGIDGPTDGLIENLALVAILGFLVHGLLHEVAHAATTKHFGREVHRAGVGYYLFIPIAFVDTSDMWLAGKWPRAAVSFAGPYTNFLLSGLATLLIPLTQDAGVQVLLFQFALLGYVIGLANLNPLIQLDGYYILMDLLEVPNLRAKALAFLGAALWRAGTTTQNPRLSRTYAFYGTLALLYVGFIAVAILTTYQSRLQGMVSQVLPPLAAGLLGWTVAGLMACLIALRAWTDLRFGVQKARRAQATGG